MQFLENLYQGATYLAVFLGYILLAKFVANKRTTDFDDDRLIAKGNRAVAMRRIGLYVGMVVAMTGSLIGASKSFATDIGYLIVDGAIALVLLLVSRHVNDKAILPSLNNDDEAKNGNVAVGVVEFGNYLATALIICGSLRGESPSFGHSLLSTIVFFVLGQAVFVALAKVYKAFTSFDDDDLIAKGKVEAGIALASALTAFGFIMGASVAGPSLGWMKDIIGFLLTAVIGLILLPIARIVIDKYAVPHIKFTEMIEAENGQGIAGLTVHDGLLVLSAFLISLAI